MLVTRPYEVKHRRLCSEMDSEAQAGARRCKVVVSKVAVAPAGRAEPCTKPLNVSDDNQ